MPTGSKTTENINTYFYAVLKKNWNRKRGEKLRKKKGKRERGRKSEKKEKRKDINIPKRKEIGKKKVCGEILSPE